MTFPTEALKFLTAIFLQDAIDDESRINVRGLAPDSAAQEQFVSSMASLSANGTGQTIVGWNGNSCASIGTPAGWPSWLRPSPVRLPGS